MKIAQTGFLLLLALGFVAQIGAIILTSYSLPIINDQIEQYNHEVNTYFREETYFYEKAAAERSLHNEVRILESINANHTDIARMKQEVKEYNSMVLGHGFYLTEGQYPEPSIALYWLQNNTIEQLQAIRMQRDAASWQKYNAGIHPRQLLETKGKQLSEKHRQMLLRATGLQVIALLVALIVPHMKKNF